MNINKFKCIVFFFGLIFTQKAFFEGSIVIHNKTDIKLNLWIYNEAFGAFEQGNIGLLKRWLKPGAKTSKVSMRRSLSNPAANVNTINIKRRCFGEKIDGYYNALTLFLQNLDIDVENNKITDFWIWPLNKDCSKVRVEAIKRVKGRPLIYYHPSIKKDKGAREFIVRYLYKTLLKREPDKGGKEYYIGRLKKGESIYKIYNRIKDSGEYKDLHK